MRPEQTDRQTDNKLNINKLRDKMSRLQSHANKDVADIVDRGVAGGAITVGARLSTLEVHGSARQRHP